MIERKSAVIEQFSHNNAQAVGAARYFHNDAVDLQGLLSGAKQDLARHVADREVLVLQDTSEANFASKSGRLRYHDSHLGPVGNAIDVGFFVHASLVLDAESGLPLGLADVEIWNRSWQQPDKHARRYQQLPIEEKESYRWVESSERAQTALSEAASVTIIADREGDIYEWFARTPDAKTDLLVRSRIDRRLVDGKLYGWLSEQAVAGDLRFSVRSSHKRKGRDVVCDVRFAQVSLARPKRAPEHLPESLVMWAVEVREVSAPPGEQPIVWHLLTSAPVERPRDALLVVARYRWRWQIEQLFRTVKSQGFDLESSQLSRGASLKKLSLMSLSASVVVMQLVQERDGGSSAPATWVFSEQELVFLQVLCRALSGATVKQQNPHEASTLAWASWVIGRLGGWKCYGSPPGPIRMARGLRRFADQYAGWRLSSSDLLSEERARDVYGD